MNVSTQLRELADVVERVEDGVDVEVQDARLAGVSVDDAIRADLTVFAPITAEEEPVEVVTGPTEDVEATADEEAICSECGESHEDGACWDDEEEPEDDAVDEVEHVCNVDGCDYSTDTERGLAIHRGRVHGGDDAPTTEEEEVEDDASSTQDEEDDTPSVEGQVVDVLEEHGELSSADIEFYLETKSSQYWNAIASMKRAGRIEARQDPEDRRRNLYRLVDEDEEDVDAEESTEDEDREVVDVVDEDDSEDEEDVAEEADVDDVEEPEDTFPRECHCGATLNDTFELAIHRTEEHGVPQSTLGHLEPGEFETIVREADGIQDVVDDVGWSRGRTLRALGIYELTDVVGEHEDIEEQSEPAEVATVTDGGAGASVAESPPPTEQLPEQSEEPDDADAFDPGEYGLDREDLVAALTGAQTVYQVQRELRFDRKTTSEILAGVGLLDQLSTGCPAITPREAETAVEGVA